MQNSYIPKMGLAPIATEEQDTRNVIRAMSATIKSLLLDEDKKIMSMYLNNKGTKGIFHSLNIHGNMVGTGWNTTIVISRNAASDMITFKVNLPRGRRSYKTDILARLVTEEVTQKYAEHALVQLLRTNGREDVLSQIL
jgi:hypothetical protein